jgi:hypothetical protein
VSTVGLLFLALTAGPGTPSTGPAIEADGPDVAAASDGAAPIEPPLAVAPRRDAIEHLARAHEHEAAGDLDAAEADVSTAIALGPDEASSYLARAQIRMSIADRHASEDPAAQRARAALLRLAAQDVGRYIELARLPADDVAWFRARQEALLREAEALDPRPVVVTRPELEPVPVPVPVPDVDTSPVTRPRRSRIDLGPRQRTGAWIGTGSVAAAVGLAGAALHIEQRCAEHCSVRWRPNLPMLVPAAVLATLGTTSIAVGLAGAPALDRRGPRRAVIASGFALGVTAVVLGTITAAVAGARWSAPASPSDDASLAVMQALGNASAASFTAALPLLGAGTTAWIRGRAVRSSERLARRRIWSM